MDDRQLEIYSEVRRLIKEEMKEAESSGAKGGMILLQMDFLSKAALDPRLFKDDIREVTAVVVEQAAVAGRYKQWLDGGRRGKEPKAPLPPETTEFLQKRLNMLHDLGLDRIEEEYAESGRILPKYVELAQYVRQNAACGHIVFADYNDCHKYIAEALVAIVGADKMPLSRIAIVTGDLSPEEREQISVDFNGADQEIDEATGEVITPAKEPLYDVIIGNSQVMSEGIDLQRRTCAIHHMTLPWEPATLTQRNGRGVRQGNTLEAVALRYYIAERSFDGYKMDMVIGKSGWQKTLYDPGVREMANPAAAGLTREEAMIWLVADDPEEAKKLVAQVQAQKAETVRKQQRDEAKAGFTKLVEQYEKARQNPDPSTRAVLFERADRLADELRLQSDDALPNKDVLDIARDYPVFYDFDTGVFFHQGEYVCLGSAHPDEARIQRHVEVMRIDPAKGGAYFTVRGFGQPRAHGDFAVTGILGRGVKGPARRLPPEECGPWDVAQDEQRILDLNLGVADFLDLGVIFDRLGDRLWRRAVEDWTAERSRGDRVVDADEIGMTPLVKGDAILLLPSNRVEGATSAARRRDLRRWLLDSGYTLLPPLKRASWVLLSNALQRDNINVLRPTGHLPYNAPEAPSGFVPSPLRLDGSEQPSSEDAAFVRMVRNWFRRPEGVSQTARKEWRAARVRKEKRAAAEAAAVEEAT